MSSKRSNAVTNGCDRQSQIFRKHFLHNHFGALRISMLRSNPEVAQRFGLAANSPIETEWVKTLEASIGRISILSARIGDDTIVMHIRRMGELTNAFHDKNISRTDAANVATSITIEYHAANLRAGALYRQLV